MPNFKSLLERNNQFNQNFNSAGLPVIPKLRTVVLTCADARVDPAHIFKLDLGESVVMRNSGGRVTKEIIEEIATMAFLVAKMDGEKRGPFELIIMQHTHCGVERYADPNFQKALKDHIGIDVSSLSISNHEKSLREDIEQLRIAPEIPGYIIVSGCIYDVENGTVNQVIKPTPLESMCPNINLD
jgi:carbonic anhydrase